MLSSAKPIDLATAVKRDPRRSAKSAAIRVNPALVQPRTATLPRDPRVELFA